MPCRLQDLSSLTRNWIQALAVKVPSPDHWTTREFPIHFLKFQFCGLKTPYNLSLVVAQSLLFGVSVFLPVKRYVICAFMYIHIYIYTHTHTHTHTHTPTLSSQPANLHALLFVSSPRMPCLCICIYSSPMCLSVFFVASRVGSSSWGLHKIDWMKARLLALRLNFF